MKTTVRHVLAFGLSALAGGLPCGNLLAKEAQDGTVHLPAFDLPLSELLSAETLAVLKRNAKETEELNKKCPVKDFDKEAMLAVRRCYDEHYFPAVIARHRARYPVAIEPKTLGGVPTEIVTPAEGVAAGQRQRVLINLHGGGFLIGGRWGGQVESIPIAATGKFKVVSVDYRMVGTPKQAIH